MYHFVIKKCILCVVSMSFTSLAAFHLDLLNSSTRQMCFAVRKRGYIASALSSQGR